MRNTILVFVFLSLLLPLCAQAAAQEQIALEAASNQGTFMVEIAWTPHDIGSANVFDIRFLETETREEVEDVVYDISIYRDADREILRRDQTVTRQEFTFNEPGSYMIRIDNIDGLDERVVIPIQVTPEFPLGALSLVAVAFGAAVLIARRNSNNLSRQPSI